MTIQRKGIFISVSLLGIFPLIWFLCLILFVFRAKYFLGYWPSPYHPDPKLLPFDFHYSVLFYGAYFVLGSLLALPAFRLFFPNLVPSLLWRTCVKFFILGWGLILPALFIYPINFVAWFLD